VNLTTHELAVLTLANLCECLDVDLASLCTFYGIDLSSRLEDSDPLHLVAIDVIDPAVVCRFRNHVLEALIAEFGLPRTVLSLSL
jgi:hypothetical protein